MSGKIRVLIVDDIAESRDNGAKLLRFEPDVEVVGMADNGEQALSLCERLEPSIVLMDVNMPGMNGLDVLDRIQNEHKARNLPILMLTTEAERALVERAKKAGAKGWLLKPIKPELLVSTVARLSL